MPRARLCVLVCLVVGLTGCGSTGARDPKPVTQAQCRHDWEGFREALAENGDPDRPDTILAGRYAELVSTVTRLATQARAADCPARIAAEHTQVDAFFDLSFEVDSFDMPFQLGIAEGNLRHAVATRDYDPLPPRLARAFAAFRSSAPQAGRDLAATLDRVSDIPLTKAAAKDAHGQLAAVAATSAAYQRCQRALRVIATFELDEE